jgi:RHS repeat-associated protein
MRNRVIGLLLFMAASVCFAGGYGPPVISSGWGGCGSYGYSRIRVSGLYSNPLFPNNLVNVDPLPPLNASFGYVGDSGNFLKTFILSLMPDDAIFPFDPSTGQASGMTTFNVFARPTQIQVTVDQKQRLISVSFVDPFDGTQQKATGSYTPTSTIRTLGGNPQAWAGDPFATGSGEQLQTPGPDLAMNGPFPVAFRRYYASYLTFGGVNSALGQNWLHNYDVHLYLKNGYASILLADGTNVYFKQSGGGYQPVTPLNYPAQFVATAGGYRFLDTSVNLIYGFDGSGNLIRIEDRNGNGVDIQQGPNGPTQVSDGLGRLLVFSYTGTNLSSVKDGSGRMVAFTQTNGNLTKVTDTDGNFTQYTYSVASYFSGLISSITTPRANKLLASVVYDSQGRVVQQTDSRNHITSVSYASTGTVVKNPVGNTVTDQYQNGSVLSSTIDGLGDSTSYVRDSMNRIISVTDRNGNKSSITYDTASGYIASTTDAEGNTTRYTYQAQSQSPFTFYVLAKVAYPDNTSESFTYDAKGNVAAFSDRDGNTSKYTYNSRGQVLAETNAAGGVINYTYGNDGTLASVMLPSGNTTMYAYDPQFRVKQITEADGSTRTFAYDNRDNLLSTVDELGQTTTSTFDGDGNLASSTDALGGQTTNSYDSEDNLSQVTNAVGASTVYSYNDANLLTGIANGAGQPRTISYDAAERITSIKGPNGKGTSYSYDKQGGVASVSDPLNRTVKFTRNKEGLITRITTPAGENHDVTRDALGRVTTSKDPRGATTTYRYDSEGRVTAISAPAGISAGFGYDALGFEKQVTDPNGNTWFSSRDSQGRLMTSSDPLGSTISYQYDQRDRLAGGTHALGSFTITRDAAGRPLQRAYSDGTTIAATRDAKGRITAANNVALSYDALDRITSSNGLAITYAGGRIGSVTYAPGLTVTYTSTAGGLTITDWAGGSLTIANNDAGQIASVTRANGVVTQYTYDADGRVASITESSGSSTLASTSIKRDANGRITATDQNVPQFNDPVPGVLQLGYDAAEQVAGSTYDALGRLNADALRSYNWDLASRLTSYSGADGSAIATYDDAGLRVSHTGADGTVLNYVWNYATSLPTVATVQSGGADLRYYVYTPDGTLLYSIEAADSTRHYYHFDQSGSTLFLTDDNANVTDTYAITPFGESVAHSGSMDNPFTWLGQLGAMQEGSTSLFYLRTRYYDSATARFLSRDPLPSNDPREISPYQYAADNPVTNDDATGLRVNNRVAIEWSRSMFNYNYPCYYDSRAYNSRYRLISQDLEGVRNGSSWNRGPSEPSRAGGRDSRDSSAPLFDWVGISNLQLGLPFGDGPGGRSTGLRYIDLSLIGSTGQRGRE